MGKSVSIGIGLGAYLDGVPSPADILAIPRLAEDLGYDALWIGDHIFPRSPMLDALSTLAMFGALSRRLRIGTSVLLLPLRNPVVLARAVASVDYLTGGRVILGVGAGGDIAAEYAACGVPVAERGRRTEEGIKILRALWQQGPASYHGRFRSFEAVELRPAPAQPGGPPILVGGRAEAALARAGRLGDGWIAYLVSPDRFRSDFERARGYAAAAGRDAAAFAGAALVFVSLAPNRDQARERAEVFLSRTYGRSFVGLAEQLCAVGDADDCTARLAAYVAAGVGHLILRPVCADAQWPEQMRAYTEQIVPKVRALSAALP